MDKEIEKEYSQKRTRIAFRVSAVTIAVNFVLAAFKLFAGIFAHSMAMVGDAVHSASDVFSTFLVMIGIKLGGKAKDKKHPYGHERMECVAAIILALVLGATGAILGYDGAKRLIEGNYSEIVTPGVLALVAAVVSIVVKEGMFWYTRAAAKKIDSGALKADAWHHRSDALSSIGAFVGILGARLGVKVLEPVASLIICLMILKAAVDIFIDAVRKMTDEACDPETEEKLGEVISAVEGVVDIDKLLTRKFGDRIYVETEISVCGDVTLRESHAVATQVHNSIEEAFPQVKHVTVHVNPSDHDEDEADN